ncbi:zinc finger MYM-type protein 1-like [Pelodytes ibericus]
MVEKIQTGSDAQIQERRRYLKRIVAITSFLGKQGISFKGHNETEESHNTGHFKECLHLLSKFDPFLQNYSPPANATYTSPSSQNAMIQCCSDEVTSRIVSEMKASGVYLIMADEARDHQKEQLPICICYVLPENGEIKEHFLSFKELKDFNADSITESLQECLKENGLDSLLCVAQTYDGAAVMSGASGGVQAKFKKYHPEAIYVHCYAHELNLILCHTCKAIKDAKDFFNTMENLYAFFSTSLINHQKFKDVQSTLGLKPGELVQLYETRWSCQIRSVNTLVTNFAAVYKCLSGMKSSTAIGLFSKLKKISVIFCLFMFQSLFSITEGFHKMLQKENLDLAKAADLKEAVCSTLKSMRTPEKASELLQKAETLLASINTEGEGVAAQRKKQKYMEDYVTEPSFSQEDIGSKDYFRTKLFFPCVDRMLSELDHRFSSINKKLMKGIQACSPVSPNFLPEDLAEIGRHYKVELKCEEVLVAKHFFGRKQQHGEQLSMVQIYQQLDPLMFPTVKKNIQIALTIPVSSCSCGRSFSALRRLHNWLRCTMGQPRLNNLAILSIEKQVLFSISEEDIIDRFGHKQTRRQALTFAN